MWRERIFDVCSTATFRAPCSPEEIDQIEQSLSITLPPELRGLLDETDGVVGEYGLNLIWPAERIAKDNLQFRTYPDFRTLYMPFDSLLFFGDAGNGDQFAFPVLDGEIRRKDIFAWNHEDDSRTWIAPSLEQFFEWFFSGKIKL